MIQYMPFTYLSDGLIGQLASAVGAFAVCQPVETLQSANLDKWIQKGVVRPLFPIGLNSDQLHRAVDEFNQWGSIHQGRLAAMAAMCLSDQSQVPIVDEHAPTRISTLIRHYENRDADSRPDEMFRAVLFLAMAQIYDEQQEEISGTLDTVQRMEMEMVSELAGDPGELKEALYGISVEGSAFEQDRGLLLTDQRISAWATAACRIGTPAHLYLTTSQAVFNALLDRLPENKQVAKWHRPMNKPGPEPAAAPGEAPLDNVIKALATSGDPLTEMADLGTWHPNGDSSLVMEIGILPGRKPHEVLSGLAGVAVSPQSPSDGITNTVFGYLAI